LRGPTTDLQVPVRLSELIFRPRGLRSVPMQLALKNVQLIGEELALQWNDGDESYFPLERLRRACPCATCGGEPDVLGNIARPDVTYTDKSFELTGWQLIGGYALQPRWADGHSTGLYSFQYLRRLSAASPS
jgi:DUF971 family protein